jgi:hypothetical protein
MALFKTLEAFVVVKRAFKNAAGEPLFSAWPHLLAHSPLPQNNFS